MYRYEPELQAIITTTKNLRDLDQSADREPAYAARAAAVAAYDAATGTEAGTTIARKASVYVGYTEEATHALERAAEDAALFPLRADFTGAEAILRQMRDAHTRLCNAHLAAIDK